MKTSGSINEKVFKTLKEDNEKLEDLGKQKKGLNKDLKKAEMKTSGPISEKVFRTLQEDNQMLQDLGKKMKCLNKDFENMRDAREKAKLELKKKFQDVYEFIFFFQFFDILKSKIENTKDFIAKEGKRINDTLLEFQDRFTTNLDKLEQKLESQHNKFAQECNDNFNKDTIRMDKIDEKIEEETKERIQQSKEQFDQLKQKLQAIDTKIKTEGKERTEGEKNLLQKLAEEVKKLNEALEKEKAERILKAKDLRDYTQYELTQLEKLNSQFNIKTKEEFQHVSTNLEKEMNNRFNHQDQIVDDLSNVVKTIQDTLKVLGKDI